MKPVIDLNSIIHNFSTHLLDNGTNIKYKTELLGHFDIETTERYLNLSNKQSANIVNPFDDLWKSNNIDW